MTAATPTNAQHSLEDSLRNIQQLLENGATTTLPLDDTHAERIMHDAGLGTARELHDKSAQLLSYSSAIATHIGGSKASENLNTPIAAAVESLGHDLGESIMIVTGQMQLAALNNEMNTDALNMILYSMEKAHHLARAARYLLTGEAGHDGTLPLIHLERHLHHQNYSLTINTSLDPETRIASSDLLILQQCRTNTYQHAHHANNVTLQIDETPEGLRYSWQDDGDGMLKKKTVPPSNLITLLPKRWQPNPKTEHVPLEEDELERLFGTYTSKQISGGSGMQMLRWMAYLRGSNITVQSTYKDPNITPVTLSLRSCQPQPEPSKTPGTIITWRPLNTEEQECPYLDHQWQQWYGKEKPASAEKNYSGRNELRGGGFEPP